MHSKAAVNQVSILVVRPQSQTRLARECFARDCAEMDWNKLLTLLLNEWEGNSWIGLC